MRFGMFDRTHGAATQSAPTKAQENVMSKIIELRIEETKAVVGGAATLAYNPSTVSQPMTMHAPISSPYGTAATGTTSIPAPQLPAH
jgi:hypothetical protein